MSDDQLVVQLKAVADPVRIEILRLLPETSEDCEELYNVSELAEEVGVSQPTVSHHLKVLKHAKLVRCEKMCRDVYYWVHREETKRVLGDLQNLIGG